MHLLPLRAIQVKWAPCFLILLFNNIYAQDSIPVKRLLDSLPQNILSTIDTSKAIIQEDSLVLSNVTEPKVKKVLTGVASFYSNKFNGRRTANGEIFSQSKLTCACNKLPLGTWIRVTNIRNGKKVVVKVNDRLHKKNKRLIDITRAAAHKLGFVSHGLAKVKVEVLDKKPLK